MSNYKPRSLVLSNTCLVYANLHECEKSAETVTIRWLGDVRAVFSSVFLNHWFPCVFTRYVETYLMVCSALIVLLRTNCLFNIFRQYQAIEEMSKYCISDVFCFSPYYLLLLYSKKHSNLILFWKRIRKSISLNT